MRAKHIPTLLLVGAALIGACSSSAPVPGETAESSAAWLTDFEEAQAIAKKDGKRLFLNFSGSDWCGWCKRLDREIFSKKEFLDYAAKNLVLVVLDFPRRSKLPEKLQTQNKKLSQKYGIRGFPTLIVLNAQGQKIGQMGYMRGGPKPFIEALDKIK